MHACFLFSGKPFSKASSKFLRVKIDKPLTHPRKHPHLNYPMTARHYFQTLTKTPIKSSLLYLGVFLIGVCLAAAPTTLPLGTAIFLCTCVGLALLAYKKPSGWGWLASLFYFILLLNKQSPLFVPLIGCILWAIHTMIWWKATEGDNQ
jgi:hypothetical protein